MCLLDCNLNGYLLVERFTKVSNEVKMCLYNNKSFDGAITPELRKETLVYRGSRIRRAGP